MTDRAGRVAGTRGAQGLPGGGEGRLCIFFGGVEPPGPVGAVLGLAALWYTEIYSDILCLASYYLSLFCGHGMSLGRYLPCAKRSGDWWKYADVFAMQHYINQYNAQHPFFRKGCV